MPDYSYGCQACKKTFTVHLTMLAHDKRRIKCPKCGSHKIHQKIAAFSVKTSKKS